MPATALRCRNCATDHPLEQLAVCSKCLAPLEPTYDWEALARTVSRIDRTSNEVVRIFVDDGPASVIADGDGVWVGNTYAGTLSRIDAKSNRVSSVRLGSAPRALTLVNDELWTASNALANTEHIGGTLNVVSPPGEGTTLRAELPLDSLDLISGAD